MKAINQTFSAALDACKNGSRIAREGWNGKGMFVFLEKGSFAIGPDHAKGPEPMPRFVDGISCDHFDRGDFGTCTRLPNLNMRAASGSTVTGWLASQTDMLADDWCILD